MHQRGRSLPPIGRQNAPHMALANPEQFGRLRYRQLADHHAVQYLQSRLFVLIQCHSSLKVTCSLTSWLLTFSLNNHRPAPSLCTRV